MSHDPHMNNEKLTFYQTEFDSTHEMRASLTASEGVGRVADIPQFYFSYLVEDKMKFEDTVEFNYSFDPNVERCICRYKFGERECPCLIADGASNNILYFMIALRCTSVFKYKNVANMIQFT